MESWCPGGSRPHWPEVALIMAARLPCTLTGVIFGMFRQTDSHQSGERRNTPDRLGSSWKEEAKMADKHTTEEEPIETVRVREVVGVLHTHEDLDTVVRGLTSAGFNRADIDLMASRDAILRKLKMSGCDLAQAQDHVSQAGRSRRDPWRSAPGTRIARRHRHDISARIRDAYHDRHPRRGAPDSGDRRGGCIGGGGRPCPGGGRD